MQWNLLHQLILITVTSFLLVGGFWNLNYERFLQLVCQRLVFFLVYPPPSHAVSKVSYIWFSTHNPVYTIRNVSSLNCYDFVLSVLMLFVLLLGWTLWRWWIFGLGMWWYLVCIPCFSFSIFFFQWLYDMRKMVKIKWSIKYS